MPTSAQLAIRTGDPVLLMHDNGPPTYRRAGRDPYRMPSRTAWLIRLVAVDDEGPDASTVELKHVQPLPNELHDLVTLVDAQLVTRDTAQGLAPGYVAAGRWDASVNDLGPWAGDQMNVLYAAVLRRPRPIPDGPPCSRCKFAIRVRGGDARPRATQAPCTSCTEPQNDRHDEDRCWHHDDADTESCAGALHQLGRRLICGRHALLLQSGLEGEELSAALRARQGNRSIWRLDGDALPSAERLLRWAYRVVGKEWSPRSSRSRR